MLQRLCGGPLEGFLSLPPVQRLKITRFPSLSGCIPALEKHTGQLSQRKPHTAQRNEN